MSTKHEPTKWLGKKFGRLLVVNFDSITTSKQADRIRNKYMYKCKCDCGVEVLVATSCLNNHKSGTKSCGCFKKEQVKIGHDKQRGKARPQLHKPNGYSVLHSAFLSCKYAATKRNLSFLLSELEFEIITSKNCHYCDKEPILKKKPKEHVFRRLNGIDRMDSKKGYTVENCVPCCKICNYMKQELSIEDWLSHMKKVLSRFLKLKDQDLE